MIEFALRAHLLATPDVTALVGTRVYPAILPQDTPRVPYVLPAITYHRVSRLIRRTLTGPGLKRPRIQVDSWAVTYAEAKALAAAVEGALTALRGPAGIRGVLADTDRDLYEPDTKVFRTSADYFVWFA